MYDFDGTLYRKNDQRHYKSVIEQIRKTESGGSRVAVASGRPLHLLKPFFEDFDNMYFISSDGAVFSRGFDIISDRHIDKTELKKFAEKNRIDYVAYGQCISYMNVSDRSSKIKIDKFFRGHTVKINSIDEINEDVYKVFFIGETKNADFLEKCWNSYGISEYTAKGVNKGYGLCTAREYLGFKREETIAVGDGLNDISMMEQAGTSCAMISAPPAVKAKADKVTDDILNILRGEA